MNWCLKLKIYLITKSFFVVTKNDWFGRQAGMFLPHYAHNLSGALYIFLSNGCSLVCGCNVTGAGSYNFVMCCTVYYANCSGCMMMGFYL